MHGATIKIKMDVIGEHYKDTKRVEMPQDGITI